MHACIDVCVCVCVIAGYYLDMHNYGLYCSKVVYNIHMIIRIIDTQFSML